MLSVSIYACCIRQYFVAIVLKPRFKIDVVIMIIRGVLGNKCAGQHNLKTVHFRDTLASGNYWAWSSAICVFFCSALSTPRRRQQAFM